MISVETGVAGKNPRVFLPGSQQITSCHWSLLSTGLTYELRVVQARAGTCDGDLRASVCLCAERTDPGRGELCAGGSDLQVVSPGCLGQSCGDQLSLTVASSLSSPLPSRSLPGRLSGPRVLPVTPAPCAESPCCAFPALPGSCVSSLRSPSAAGGEGQASRFLAGKAQQHCPDRTALLTARVRTKYHQEISWPFRGWAPHLCAASGRPWIDFTHSSEQISSMARSSGHLSH